jgi:hypothetical protein
VQFKDHGCFVYILIQYVLVVDFVGGAGGSGLNCEHVVLLYFPIRWERRSPQGDAASDKWWEGGERSDMNFVA